MEQTNNQKVKYNLPNAEEQKKKNRRITGIFVLLTTIVIDVCSLLAYFATLKDKEKKETYVVSEESKSIYNNLLTYIENICDDEGHWWKNTWSLFKTINKIKAVMVIKPNSFLLN